MQQCKFTGTALWYYYRAGVTCVAIVILCKVWFSFMVLKLVVVVQGSPTTDLLKSMDYVLRDCDLPNADRNNTEK